MIHDSRSFLITLQEGSGWKLIKHWLGNENAAETKSLNTSFMLLRVNIHEKYACISEQKMRHYTSLDRFSWSSPGPQGRRGGWRVPSIVVLAAPCQLEGHSVLSSRQLFSGWLEISINQSSFYRSHFPWLCHQPLTQGEIFLSMAWQPQVFN